MGTQVLGQAQEQPAADDGEDERAMATGTGAYLRLDPRATPRLRT